GACGRSAGAVGRGWRAPVREVRPSRRALLETLVGRSSPAQRRCGGSSSRELPRLAPGALLSFRAANRAVAPLAQAQAVPARREASPPPLPFFPFELPRPLP